MTYNFTLSIIIPVYGVEKYIERCAKSVLSQLDSHTQVIFVDDCSKDKSINILQQFISEHSYKNKNNISILTHTVNKGLAASRLTGLNAAAGKYVMFLDSDDELAPNSIAFINKWVLSEPDIIVMGMIDIFPDKEVYAKTNNTIPQSKNEYLFNVLSRDCLGTMCGKVFLRTLFTKETQFIEGINYGEDYVTLPRILNVSNHILDKTDTPLYMYHHEREDSFTGSLINKTCIDQILHSVEILSHYFSENKSILDAIRVRNHIFLLEYSQLDYIEYIKDRLPISHISLSGIPFKHRIVGYLSKLSWNIPLTLFIKFAHIFKSKFKI